MLVTILKGILLYTTIILISLFIMGIDSIFEANLASIWIAFIGLFLILCNKYLTIEDIRKLSLVDYIDKLSR